MVPPGGSVTITDNRKNTMEVSIFIALMSLSISVLAIAVTIALTVWSPLRDLVKSKIQGAHYKYRLERDSYEKYRTWVEEVVFRRMDGIGESPNVEHAVKVIKAIPRKPTWMS